MGADRKWIIVRIDGKTVDIKGRSHYIQGQRPLYGKSVQEHHHRLRRVFARKWPQTQIDSDGDGKHKDCTTIYAGTVVK